MIRSYLFISLNNDYNYILYMLIDVHIWTCLCAWHIYVFPVSGAYDVYDQFSSLYLVNKIWQWETNKILVTITFLLTFHTLAVLLPTLFQWLNMLNCHVLWPSNPHLCRRLISKTYWYNHTRICCNKNILKNGKFH